MFTKNIFKDKDTVADLVGNILEADYKVKKEELKGNQHKIDMNKNNKIDAHDFKLLRSKGTQKEEVEGVTEGGILKSIKRGLQGWGGDAPTPKELVRQNKGHSDDTIKALARDTRNINPHTPGGLQKRVVDREMKKRGLAQKGVEEAYQKNTNTHDDLATRAISRISMNKTPAGKKKEFDRGTELLKHQMRTTKATGGVSGPKGKLPEEVEQIDELNKDTLYSYNKKAGADVEKKDKSLGQLIRKGDSVGANKTARQLNNRLAGQERAEKRLNKEEVEQIDELKKSTLKSYTKKADAEVSDIKKKQAEHPRGHISGSDADKKLNRQIGINQATKRIVKKDLTGVAEEVEQFDERTLTPGETSEKERIVKGMKKSLAGFKQRYGDRAKSVMYATATKAAKED